MKKLLCICTQPINPKKRKKKKKRILVMFILFCVFLITNVMALEFDNAKSYDPSTKTATITNSFGMGSEVAQIKLLSPQHRIMFPGDYAFELEFTLPESYDGAIDQFDFYEAQAKSLKAINSPTFELKYYDPEGTYKEIIYEYEQTCKDIGNGTTCTPTIKSSKEVTKSGTWVSLSEQGDLPSGKTVVRGYYPNIKPGQLIEWIPTLFGVEIEEWADFEVWTKDANFTAGSDDNDFFIYNTTANDGAWGGNLFKAENNIKIIGISVWLKRVGDPVTNLSIWIYNGTDASTMPSIAPTSGHVLYNGTDVSTIGTSFAQYNLSFNVANYSLTKGDYYGFAFHGGGNQTSDTISIKREDTEDYAYGRAIVGNSTDWNSGIGASYDIHFELFGGSVMGVTLESPADNYNTTVTSINFSGNFSSETDYGNLVNTTLYVWYPFNSTFRINTTEVTGSTNETVRSLGSLATGEGYEWNYYVCSTGACSFALLNRSFDIDAYTINSQTFNATTSEGDTERYLINITPTSGLQLTETKLHYNGSSYDATFTKYGSDYVVSRVITVPSVTATSNKSFYWQIGVSDGGQSNTSIQNQTVEDVGLDDCTTNPILILNYSHQDEEDQTVITTPINTTIDIQVTLYPVGSTTVITNFSQRYTNESNPQVCIAGEVLNNSEFAMSVTTRYDGEGYSNEYHNIQRTLLTNSSWPENINLFDLNDSDATKFVITFKDDTFVPVSGALFDITRQYVEEGVFKTVESPVTDSQGQAIAWLDTNNQIYTIIVKRNRTILSTFENVAVFCEDEVIGDCTINLNEVSSTTGITDWEEESGLSYTFAFDRDTRTVTVTFTVLDGSSKTIDLNTTKMDRFQNITVCSDTLTSSSGTLTCAVPASYGNLTVVSELSADGELIVIRTFSVRPDASETFGSEGILMILILLITLPLIAITDKIGMIIMTFIGVIAGGLLMLTNTGSIFGTGSVVMWAVIAGGIIIWKLAKDD